MGYEKSTHVERRKSYKHFNVELEREKAEELERYLASIYMTKTMWLNMIIDKTLKEAKKSADS